MSKEENSGKIDPMFDGHLEKSILEMTPGERLDYLWTLIEFKEIIKDRKIITKKESNNG